MDIQIRWHKPIKLQDGSNENLIYKINNISQWAGVSGVYMFCRCYGKTLTPLYIGKAESIGARIKQQLNSTKLMKGIENSLSGEKVLVVGEFVPRSGQDLKKAIAVAEKSLIEHALAQGYVILNIQGTKTPTNSVSFSGYSGAKNITGAAINIKKPNNIKKPK
jgi:hypothetical protein